MKKIKTQTEYGAVCCPFKNPRFLLKLHQTPPVSCVIKLNQASLRCIYSFALFILSMYFNSWAVIKNMVNNSNNF